MDNGQWTMDNGQWTWTWTMDNGQWTMDNGQWTMDMDMDINIDININIVMFAHFSRKKRSLEHVPSMMCTVPSLGV